MAGISWAPAATAPLGASVSDDVPGRARVALGAGGDPASGATAADLRVDLRWGPAGVFVVATSGRARSAGVAATARGLDLGLGVRAGTWVSRRVGFGAAARVTVGRTWKDAGVMADLDDRWTAELVPSLVVGERGEGPLLWLGPDVALVRTRAVGLSDPAQWRMHLGAEVGAALWSTDLAAAHSRSVWMNISIFARISARTDIGASVGVGW